MPTTKNQPVAKLPLTEKDLIAPTVIVRGFREAIRASADAKQNAEIVLDSIHADDISKFPDLNLAEALQRIPGVSITRERGEGARISLRGLGPEFARVQIDGLEVLVNSDRGREFEFNSFETALFNQIDVLKSYDVSIEAGVIGGTVNLKTPRPLDYEDSLTTVSGQIGTNSNAQNTDSRFSGLTSHRFQSKLGEIGVLFSLAGSDRISQGQDASTFRYRAAPIPAENLTGLEPDQAAKFAAGEIFLPRGNRYRISKEEQTRLGLNAAVQWRPTQKSSVDVSAFLTKYDVKRSAFNIQTRGSNSFPFTSEFMVDGELFGPTTILNATTNSNSELTFGVFENALIGSETTSNKNKVDFFQFNAIATHHFKNNWRLSGQFGLSESDSTAFEDKFYLETLDELILDYTGDRRFNPRFDYGGVNGPVDVSEWRAHELDLRNQSSKNVYRFARSDLSVPINEQNKLTGGISWKRFANTGQDTSALNVLRSEFQDGSVNDDVSALGFHFNDHPSADWIAASPNTALNTFSLDRNSLLSIPSSDFKVSENSASLYGKWSSSFTVLDRLTEMNLGLRYLDTERSIQGNALILDSMLQIEQISRENLSENNWLPSINVRHDLSGRWALRAAYSQNITYPPISALNPTTILRTINFQDAAVGNVELNPYRSDNLDVYFEGLLENWYAAAGVFWKRVDNFVTRQARPILLEDLGIPLADLPVELDANSSFILSTFSNAQDTEIFGLELGLQADFTFLPSPFDNLGMIGNYTYAEGDFDYLSIDGAASVTASFPGLSEHSANFTLYYETDNLGLRTSLAYRSDYLTAVEPSLLDEDSRGNLDTLFVDLAGYYNITPSTQIILDVLNLTNEEELSYSDSSRRLTERRLSGTTFFVGLKKNF